MQVQGTSISVGAAVVLLLLSAGPAASDLVYNAAEWPEINAPVLTGSGAPVPAANQAFSAEVAFTATSDLPGVVLAADNPQSGGVCPTTGSFGANGSCWWTCAYGSDGYPCAGPNDKRVCKAGKWGLSYDDGPSASTGKLLDSLKKNSLKATFCLIGSNVVRFPELTKRIHTEGHDLCVHTWSHSPLTTLTDDQIISEVKWTEKAIIAATGVKPLYFRPPYGDIDNRVRAVVAKMGYKVLLWFFDNSDYLSFGTSPSITAATVTSNMKAGVANTKNFPQGLIALSHPERGGDSGVAIAEEFFSLAKGASISLVPVSDCLGDTSSTTSPNASTTTSSSSTKTTSSSTPAIGTTTSAAASPPVGSYLTVLLAVAVVAVAIRTVWPGNYAEKQD